MAKRRSLEIPSIERLQQLEADFHRDGVLLRPSAAPIAQVAAESAAALDVRGPEQRAALARDQVEARELREARTKGLVMLELPLDRIEEGALVRDRIALQPEEMEELKASIQRNGLRLPIEVFPLGQGGRYGLLSGYRRFRALQALLAETGKPIYGQIKALVRDPEAMGGAFAAMVEENEIRAPLSHFERGRIAVIAVQQDAFATVEAAVQALFPVASKAKRSKIRSFALVYEELGDLLIFADTLTEKTGLALAAALRDGAEPRLRLALSHARPESAKEEAAAVDQALKALSAPPSTAKRGGRPKRQSVPKITLSTGHEISARQEADGWSIQIGGGGVIDDQLIANLLEHIQLVIETEPAR